MNKGTGMKERLTISITEGIAPKVREAYKNNLSDGVEDIIKQWIDLEEIEIALASIIKNTIKDYQDDGVAVQTVDSEDINTMARDYLEPIQDLIWEKIHNSFDVCNSCGSLIHPESSHDSHDCRKLSESAS